MLQTHFRPEKSILLICFHPLRFPSCAPGHMSAGGPLPAPESCILLSALLHIPFTRIIRWHFCSVPGPSVLKVFSSLHLWRLCNTIHSFPVIDALKFSSCSPSKRCKWCIQKTFNTLNDLTRYSFLKLRTNQLLLNCGAIYNSTSRVFEIHKLCEHSSHATYKTLIIPLTSW